MENAMILAVVLLATGLQDYLSLKKLYAIHANRLPDLWCAAESMVVMACLLWGVDIAQRVRDTLPRLALVFVVGIIAVVARRLSKRSGRD